MKMYAGPANRQYLKRFALFVSSLLFLGSVEVSAYTSSPAPGTSVHKQDLSHAIDATNEIFVESGEERDGETNADIYILTDAIKLPQADLKQTKVFPRLAILKSSLVLSQQNSRAPPAP